MKILFNTSDKEISSDEIKEHIGYVDADLSFKNMLQDIITASNEMKKLLGNEVYDHIYTIYEENKENGVITYDFDDSDLNILRAVRYPIIVRSYYLFAPSNDLAHTSDGRSARVGENNKQAWEWQIEKDNKAQEKRYYRALDDLIQMLDNSKPDNYTELDEEAQKQTLYYKWINSLNYKYIKKNFLNTIDDFNKAFIIESSYLFLKLVPGIDECERTQIIPRIEAEKLERLKTANDLNNEELLLIELIKKAEAFYSIAWAIPRMSIQLFPEGVLQFQISDRMTMNAAKPAIGNEHQLAIEAFSKSFSNIILEIENLLKPEPIVVPGTIRYDIDDISPDDKHISLT